MPRTSTVVIGGGQAGLATSWHLTQYGVDHIILERGRVANSWDTQRWDSLRMITPRWMSTLPGWSYRGNDPHGYMSASEVTRYLRDYCNSFSAPVHEATEVLSVRTTPAGFEVRTNDRTWSASDVVVATGPTGRPHVPRSAAGMAPDITQLTLRDYRNPDTLPDGGVLVVGASASGLAIADELAAAGRDVVLSVGEHVWLPRELHGQDIWWWLQRSGWLSRTIDQTHDEASARREPRIQLIGRRDTPFGLAATTERGVSLVGRFLGADGSSASFAQDLPVTLSRSLARSNAILQHMRRTASAMSTLPLCPQPTATSNPPILDLRRRGIRTVIWATGNRAHYPWLHAPVLGNETQIAQYRGATSLPGLYLVGTKFQHRRDATFLDGVGHDAHDVVHHIYQRSRVTSVAAQVPQRRTPETHYQTRQKVAISRN